MELRLCKKGLMTGKWLKPFIQVSIPWIAGLFLGAFTAFCLSDNQQDMIRLLVSRNVSFQGALFSSLASFLTIILVARFMGRVCVQICLLIKASLFSLFFCYFGRCFGTAGWLVATLVFFTEIICSCCLLLFSFYLLKTKQRASKTVLIPYFVFFLLLGMFNYFVLSPFTASLF